MTPDQCIERAIERAGYDRFGPWPYREGLERALDAFARLPLKPGMIEALHERLVEDLANRLRIEKCCRDRPEIDEQRIEGPLLVCGPPRTGTTVTVAMLGLDPRFRFTRTWELMSPTPPPRLQDERDDPRAVAEREAAPRYASANQHVHEAGAPQEDLVFLAGLTMQGYHGSLPMPADYLDWYLASDFAGLYAYHRRVLKLLQWRRPPNLWLLKAPLHLFRLEEFFREYPDARFVWTHRDPASTIPSNASLQHRLYAERCDAAALDKRAEGPKLLSFWAEGMRRGLAARDAIGEERFIDLWNDDLVADPVSAMRVLYERLGYPFTPELQLEIEAYHRRNAKGAHGEHRYTAEEYGLSRDMVREAFAPYCARFGV